MQANQLLEQLDLYFTSVNWTTDYPNTEVLPLAKITSDHLPCKVAISTRIPKACLFHFENFWAEHDDFLQTTSECWFTTPTFPNSARNISTKFKALRARLKVWSKQLSNLRLLISNCNIVICFLDGLEDRRGLSNIEANLRVAVKR